MNHFTQRMEKALRWRMVRLRNNQSVRQMARQVAQHAPQANGQPVAFFNTSSRLGSMSLNAAYSLLFSWSLRLSGVPVVNFACASGMTRCIHGTNKDDPAQLPLCRECVAQSRVNFSQSETVNFGFIPDEAFESAIADLSLAEMEAFEYDGIPLGTITRSSLRWVQRRFHLIDNEPTRFLFREYLRSAWNIARAFEAFLDQHHPRALVVFNGIVYPEATARFLARRRGIPVFSHEVSLQPFSAYFTAEEATYRSLDLPEEFDLDEAQMERFNRYFSKRTKGQFKMAGVTFWKDIHGLDEAFLQKAQQFKQIVPVFTNVIFDTSQEHANTIFPHMFAWLDYLLEQMKRHPETLFVLRAHPDEARPGKASEESVAEWAVKNRIADLKNVVFIGPNESINSYELIDRSKFTLIYTSTIGMESTLLDTPVLCGGRSYFNEYQPVVHFPQTLAEYEAKLEEFLAADSLSVPAEFKRNARRFLYYQLYYASLPFSDFLEEDGAWVGYVKLKEFAWQDLLPEYSETMRVLHAGLLEGEPFILGEEYQDVE